MTLHGPPTSSRLRPAEEGWHTASLRWRGRPLHLTGRQPAGSSGLLRVGGVQEARWRGRSRHFTGRQPAAVSGRLRGGERTASSRWRGRPLLVTGCQLAAGSCRQWNWQLTDCFIESFFIQNTPVWHITKKAGNRIPRSRIVLHGARGGDCRSADPGNRVHHTCSKVAPYLQHCCQVLDEEQDLPDGTLSQHSL